MTAQERDKIEEARHNAAAIGFVLGFANAFIWYWAIFG